MTKCKHKGECICGKPSEEETGFVNINGATYIQTKTNLGVFGEIRVLRSVEEPLKKIQVPNQIIKENK